MKNFILLINLAILIFAGCKKKEMIEPASVSQLQMDSCDCKDTMSFVVTNDGVTSKTFRIYGGGTNLPLADDNTDPAFIPMAFDFFAETITNQPDGKILIGGIFTTYNGVSANRIVRLNADGSQDTGFNSGTGFNGETTFINIQSDGKIVVGGFFTSYNGTGANRIIRLNSDGSIDPSFVYGTGFNGGSYGAAIQSDGKILIAGSFTSYDGTGANRIIRLNSDGSVDPSFVYGTAFNGVTTDLYIQSDGKILAGGGFTSYDGTGANRIIRLNSDGSIDPSFVYDTGFLGSTSAIYVQSDGKIIVGGSFSSYNGTGANNIIRLNSDGSVDPSFVYGTGFTGGSVLSVKVQTDGLIVMGGQFTSYKGISANSIIRLTSTGSIDPAFNYGVGFNNYVFDISIQPDGKILAVGNFTQYNGSVAQFVTRLNTDGSINSTASSYVTIDVNGGTSTLSQINADTLSDPICICDFSVSVNSASTFNTPIQKIYRASNGNIQVEDINLLARYDADFQQNKVTVNGKDLKSCVLDGFNYLQWTIPAGETIKITVDYCQYDRAAKLQAPAAQVQPKKNTKKYVHAPFRW